MAVSFYNNKVNYPLVFPGDWLIHKETANLIDDDEERGRLANDPSDWLKTYCTVLLMVAIIYKYI